MIVRICLSALIAYLLGSVSTGILIARLRGRDIRKEGSKNTGATNVLRVVGLLEGLLTFAGDFLKAALAILIARWLCPDAVEYASMAAALFVIIGHNWPIFFGFSGGKGIACSTAVVLMTYPVYGLISIAVCILVIALTRYISAGSLTLVTLFAVLVSVTQGFWPYGVWAVLLAVSAFYRHRGNLKRILDGTENKLTFKKNKPSGS